MTRGAARTAIGLLAATLWLAGGAQAVAPPDRASRAQAERSADGYARHVDRTMLMQEAAALASPEFEGRRTGTPGALKARGWIEDRFAAIGLVPAAPGGFGQTFSISARRMRDLLPGGRPFRTDTTGANVVGRVAGRDGQAAVIVVTAHYDHLGMRDGVLYPGADDNASGVAALLAAARYFRAAPPRHPMVFAAVDAEELGLHGSRALVRSDRLPRGRIGLNVNLDMLSRSARREIYAAGSSYSPWQVPILHDIQRRASVRIVLGHDRPPQQAGGLEDWTQSSDHAPFHEAGVPFVYFGVEDHPDYHSPGDTADKIDVKFFGDVADMVVEAIRTFDERLP